MPLRLVDATPTNVKADLRKHLAQMMRAEARSLVIGGASAPEAEVEELEADDLEEIEPISPLPMTFASPSAAPSRARPSTPKVVTLPVVRPPPRPLTLVPSLSFRGDVPRATAPASLSAPKNVVILPAPTPPAPKPARLLPPTPPAPAPPVLAAPAQPAAAQPAAVQPALAQPASAQVAQPALPPVPPPAPRSLLLQQLDLLGARLVARVAEPKPQAAYELPDRQRGLRIGLTLIIAFEMILLAGIFVGRIPRGQLSGMHEGSQQHYDLSPQAPKDPAPATSADRAAAGSSSDAR